MPKVIGVYEIKVNNKRYIGSSATDIYGRWHCHKSELRRGIHPNIHLQRAFNKYGFDCFVFSIIEVAGCKEDCIVLEQKWIDKLKPEYNITKLARSRLGVKESAATRNKLKISLKGNKNALGYKHTEEALSKMSEAGKGRVWKDERRKKFSELMRGRKHSDESKKKMSQAQKGKTVTAETRQKIRESLKGHQVQWSGRHTEESKQKLRISHLGKTFSEEHKQKMSIGIKRSWEKRKAGKLQTKDDDVC